MLPELDTRITGRKNEIELEESLRMTKFGEKKTTNCAQDYCLMRSKAM
jgi:hypothetical protein